MGKPKLTTEIFIQKARERHGDKYDYSLVNYITQYVEVIIICPVHGEFLHMPKRHLRWGCNRCGMELRHANHRKTQEVFLNQCASIHGDKYDYSLANYFNENTKVEIICKIHGIFLQTPHDHLSGKGCRACGLESGAKDRRKTQEDFIKESNASHNNYYDYSQAIYVNSGTKIKIICPNHGLFEQPAIAHSRGAGCPFCNVNVSKMETQWLNSLGILKENRYYYIRVTNNKRFFVDGYDPKTRTVYEFNGDFWHGNPAVFDPLKYNKVSKRTFGELYSRTLEKQRTLESLGYTVVSIWENDYIESLKKNQHNQEPLRLDRH